MSNKENENMNARAAAVIGAGFIGPVHVEGLRRAGVPVAGILGVDKNESEQAAASLGLPKAYESLEEVLADKNVRSVHITTPNRFHYGMVKQAFEAGKHVLCEKPLAMNSTESAELVALAEKSGLVAGVNYNVRFYPMCIEAREMIKRGDLGDVFSICGSYVQDWLLMPTDYNWRVLASQGGELRAVADIGTHWLDLMHAITDLEVEAVCADLHTVHPVRHKPTGEVKAYSGKQDAATEPIDIDTDDYGAVVLRFKNGARGILWVSQVTAGRKNCLRFEISGAKQALAWDSEEPNTLWVGRRNEPNMCFARDPALVSDATREFTNYPGGHSEGFPDTFKQCFRAFYGYLDAGDFDAPPPFATFADGHREIILCDAILESHRNRCWVDIT